MLDVVRQLVGVIAAPLVLASLIAMLGLVLRLLRHRRSSTCLLVAAGAVAYLGATGFTASALLRPLEGQYPPLDTNIEPPAYIVVLGSFYAPRGNVPVTSTLGTEGLARIVEGVRLARVFPTAKMILSGGPVAGHPASAHGYARISRELGIEPSRIEIIDKPRKTSEEAAAVSAAVGSATFLLVTSAAHMPRSMHYMRAAGGHPLAAPTSHHLDTSQGWTWRSVLPLGTALRDTEIALHEYAGLLAIHLGLQ